MFEIMAHEKVREKCKKLVKVKVSDKIERFYPERFLTNFD